MQIYIKSKKLKANGEFGNFGNLKIVRNLKKFFNFFQNWKFEEN